MLTTRVFNRLQELAKLGKAVHLNPDLHGSGSTIDYRSGVVLQFSSHDRASRLLGRAGFYHAVGTLWKPIPTNPDGAPRPYTLGVRKAAYMALCELAREGKQVSLSLRASITRNSGIIAEGISVQHAENLLRCAGFTKIGPDLYHPKPTMSTRDQHKNTIEAVDMHDLNTLAALLPTPGHLRLLQSEHADLLGGQIKQLTNYFRTTLVKNISEALYNQKTRTDSFFSWRFPKEFTLPVWAGHFDGDSIEPAMTASRHELVEILRRAGYVVSYVTSNTHYEIRITWAQSPTT